MENENNNQFQRNDVFSKRIRAGKRRTYFFDVRTTKANDYYLTVTESKKRFHDDGYERHKIFVYKEDFNKFIATLEEVVDHIKNNLMPEYDFDTYNRDPEDITYDGVSEKAKSEVSAVKSEDGNSDNEATESSESSEEEVIGWD